MAEAYLVPKSMTRAPWVQAEPEGTALNVERP